LNVSSVKTDHGLLIVGHGSTVNSDSSAPTLAHAAEIRRRNLFGAVECAFWKEEPSLRDALFIFDPETIGEVYVVPNFISEGYFTETVIPRELKLTGQMTTRSNGQIWKYCEPVGSHPMMTELLIERAREIAPDVDPKQTSLLIVAHGTDLNEKSAVAAKREAEKIRGLDRYTNVLNVYMEEQPSVADWKRLTDTPNVIVVPFFISDGLHSYEDIPRMLGIVNEAVTSRSGDFSASRTDSSRGEQVAEPPVVGGHGNRRSLRPPGSRQIFEGNPYQIGDRLLFYAPAIGTDHRMADIIIAQTLRFGS
jgi:sirohydrochlorin cobaltochelatase